VGRPFQVAGDRLDPNAPYHPGIDPQTPPSASANDGHVEIGGINSSDGPGGVDAPLPEPNPAADTPTIPEIGMIPTGMVGPDFGPLTPVGEDTPPPTDTGTQPPVAKTLTSTEPPTEDGSGEPGSTMPVLNSDLLDPIAPGPTIDTGLVDQIEQSPELVNLLNQDPGAAEALEQDPTHLYQIKQQLGVGEQWSNDDPSFTDPRSTDPSFTDPGLTEQPLADQSTPDDGADDLSL
jgi:hypothetical protein